MRAAGDERLLLQGLIQLAGAFLHARAGRLPPARRLLAAAAGKLERVNGTALGVDTPPLLAGLSSWARTLAEGSGGPLPDLPELGFSGSGSLRG